MPEANPSALTTIGKLLDFKNLNVSSIFSKILKFAVGMLYFLQIFFVKIFDPSSWEAIFFGPKTLIFSFSRKSTIPLTKGFSGPITTKSFFDFNKKFLISSKLFRSISIFSAISLVPAFPGIQ